MSVLPSVHTQAIFAVFASLYLAVKPHVYANWQHASSNPLKTTQCSQATSCREADELSRSLSLTFITLTGWAAFPDPSPVWLTADVLHSKGT